MLLVKQGEVAPAETVIGKGCNIEGTIKVDGPLRIEGSVTGKIQTRDTIVVSVGARVTAEIAGATVIIHGTVEGDITASTAIELHPPARVKGTIGAPAVVIERGAIFEGACKMEGEASKAVAPQRAVA
ncbi:MAG: bactofilin family protein [Myxococcaceae bacterium]